MSSVSPSTTVAALMNQHINSGIGKMSVKSPKGKNLPEIYEICEHMRRLGEPCRVPDGNGCNKFCGPPSNVMMNFMHMMYRLNGHRSADVAYLHDEMYATLVEMKTVLEHPFVIEFFKLHVGDKKTVANLLNYDKWSVDQFIRRYSLNDDLSPMTQSTVIDESESEGETLGSQDSCPSLDSQTTGSLVDFIEDDTHFEDAQEDSLVTPLSKRSRGHCVSPVIPMALTQDYDPVAAFSPFLDTGSSPEPLPLEKPVLKRSTNCPVVSCLEVPEFKKPKLCPFVKPDNFDDEVMQIVEEVAEDIKADNVSNFIDLTKCDE